MPDSDKTKKVLLEELQTLRSRLAELERMEDEYKRTQARLRESEQRYVKAEEIGHFSHWERGLVEDKATWSEESYRIFGVDPNRFQPSYENFLNLIHPYDRGHVKSALEAASSHGKGFDIEYRIVRPDGVERVLHSVAEVRFDENSRPVKLVGTAHDITERKRAEEELLKAHGELERRVEERTADLARTNALLKEQIDEREQAQENIVRLNQCFLEFGPDTDKNISAVVETAGSILGGTCALYNRLEGGLLCSIAEWQAPSDMPRETEAKGHLCYDVISGSEERLIVRNLQQSPYAESDPNVKKYDLKTYIGCVVRVHNNPVGSLCVVHQEDKVLKLAEIEMLSILARALGVEEERRKAEIVLRESENNYRTLLENLPQRIFLKDNNSVYISCNENYAQDLNIKPEEITGKTDYEFYPKELAENYRADDRRLMESGETENIEEKYIREGQELIVHTVKTPVRDEQANVIGILGIFWDITDRKKAEEALRESEERLRLALSAADMGTWRWDPVINQDTRDASFNRILGLSAVESTQPVEDFLQRVHPDNRDMVDKEIQCAIRDRRPYLAEFRVVRPDGAIRWLRDQGKVLCDENDRVSYMTGAVVDITGRKKAEEKITRAKEEWERTFMAVPDLIAIIDRDYRIVRVNKAMAERMGVAPDEAAGMICYECIHRTKEPPAFCPHARLLANGQEHTEEIYEEHLGGDFIVSVSPLRDDEGSLMGCVHVARDITERKKTEDELLFKSTLLEAQSETSIEGILLVDGEGKSILYNKRFGQMWNIPQKILDTRDDEKMLQYVLDQLEDPNRFLEKVTYLYAHKNEKSRDEIQFKDGKVFDRYSSPLIDSNGKHYGRIWYFGDITERKQAEEALRESEQRHKALFEGAAEGILVADVETKLFLYANPAICRMLGYTPEELTQMSVENVHPADSLEHVLAEFEAQVKGEKTLAPGLPCLRKDGAIMYADINTAKISIGGRECNVGFFTDITERRRAEQALQKAHDELEIRVKQRTADLARANEQLLSLADELSLAEERLRQQIAANVHDHIGQNLAISKIKLESLRESISPSKFTASLDEICALIGKAIESSRSLTSELSPPVLYELGFEAAVEWLVKDTRQKHGLSTDFKSDGLPKPLTPNVCVLLFQAVRELLVNVAKHANARNVTVWTRRVDDEVQITVEDDGIGFDTSRLSSHSNQTRGFGLFSIRERLGYVGGRLDVDSKPGSGTRVTLVTAIDKETKNDKEKDR